MDSQVVYDNIDTVISHIRRFGNNVLMAKTDIANAFRLLPLHKDDRHLLCFTWPDENGSVQFLWIVHYKWVNRLHVSVLNGSVLLYSGL